MPAYFKFSFVLLVLFFCSAVQVRADAVNLSVGTNGVAVEYFLMLSPKVSARFLLSDMPVDVDRDDEGLTAKFKYDRTNLGFLLDLRPMAGSFHFTTGLYVGNHNLGLAGTVNGSESYDIGDESYYGRNLGVSVKAHFAKAAPYFGIGWGTIPDNSGFSVNFDLGVLYIGKASISANATGKACATDPATCTLNNSWFDVAGDPLFQEELQKQREEWQDDADKLQFLPIIQLGMGYKF